MATAVQTIEAGNSNLPAISEEGERFALMQRQARMFAMSPLVPDHLRKGPPEQAIANCWIALTLAQAMGEVPLVVMQNIHIVNGKAGFASQYMIARANSAGIFTGRIDWRIDRSDPNNLSVTAFAVLKDTGQEVSVTCDMKMAKAEGWTKNSKYTSMPEVMLRYRSAAFLVRFYAPDVMLGYQASEEIEDMGAAALPPPNALTGEMLIDQARGPDLAATPTHAEPIEAEVEQVDQTTGEVLPIEPAEEVATDTDTDTSDDAPHPARARADEILEDLRSKNAIIDVNSVWARARADVDAMPEDIAAELVAEKDRLIETIKAARQAKPEPTA